MDVSYDEEGRDYMALTTKPYQLIGVLVNHRGTRVARGGPIQPRSGSDQVVTSPPCFRSMVFLL